MKFSYKLQHECFRACESAAKMILYALSNTGMNFADDDESHEVWKLFKEGDLSPMLMTVMEQHWGMSASSNDTAINITF